MKKISLAELGITNDGISKEVHKVVRVLQENGYAAFLVGGAVRDMLLGYAPKDFDVATAARPEEIKKLFRRAWIIGKRFRMVHVRERNQLIEVATFRQAPQRSGAAERTLLTTDNVFGTVEEDAYRRDITMNSLLLDPLEKYVYDYTGGLKDIERRCMRIIGKADVRYHEDPVRMIRILRLAAKLDCSIDEASLCPIRKHAHLLEQIVHTRLLEETIKVFFSKASCKCMNMFIEHGVIEYLFPHLCNYDEEQTAFWQFALNYTDRLNRANERVSLSYVISALFWPQVAKQWKEHTTGGGKPSMELMHELFTGSGIEENPILSRVIRSKVWEVFSYQVRFQRLMKKRRASSLNISYGARKALNFLRLRNEVDEINDEMPNWWEEFFYADNKDDKRSFERQTTSTPRRKRKAKSAPSENDKSSEHSDNASPAQDTSSD